MKNLESYATFQIILVHFATTAIQDRTLKEGLIYDNLLLLYYTGNVYTGISEARGIFLVPEKKNGFLFLACNIVSEKNHCLSSKALNPSTDSASENQFFQVFISGKEEVLSIWKIFLCQVIFLHNHII